MMNSLVKQVEFWVTHILTNLKQVYNSLPDIERESEKWYDLLDQIERLEWVLVWPILDLEKYITSNKDLFKWYESKKIDPEIQQVINENFWDML